MKFVFSIYLITTLLNLSLDAQTAFSIYAPNDVSKEVVNDYIKLLQDATLQKWQPVSNESNVKSGIILKIQDNQNFTTKESFRFQSNGENLITISSSSNEGLVFGLYKYLRTLGFKFYLPDELYTITPRVSNPFGPKKDIIDKPFLQIRSFFGTGGFGTTTPDPDKSVENDWNRWKLRNGFGTAYHLSGHAGEDFILQNKEKLKQNPQWLSSPLSGNAQEDIGIKLNYTDQTAMNFFTDWTIKPFTKKDFKLPPRSHTELTSIEPSDGGGYLNDFPQNKNKKLPSISDQVYGAANVAAAKLDKLFPDHPNIGVNLYAYSSHAAPPSFPLHPRVFVQLIPYQFQNIAFGPSFIKLWAEKVKRFGIYDYFRYTDAQFDVPDGISLKETMNRLIHSVKNGSEGTNFETSFSKFSTGIPLWVIGRYMSDGNADWEKNLSAVATDLFKKNSPPINELFALFYNEPSFNMNQLGNAVALVDKAGTGIQDNVVAARINELKKYLQYLHLVNESRKITTGDKKRQLLPLAEYVWKLYETKIIHSYRVIQLISYSFLNVDKSDKDYASYQQLHNEWFPETERSKSAWSKIPQTITDSEVDRNFIALKKLYGGSVRMKPLRFNDIKSAIPGNLKPKKELVIGGDGSTRGYVGISTSKPTEIKIRYSLSSDKSLRKMTISGVDEKYTNPVIFILDQAAGELKFNIPAGETTLFFNASGETTYRMQLKINDGLFYFDGAPRGPMAFYKNFSDPSNQYTYDPGYYPSHIYLPGDAESIYYTVQLNQLNIITPDGKSIQSKLLEQFHGGVENRSFVPPANQKGKFWKAVIGGNFNYKFLNIPDIYFLLEEK